jgi:hypothetical protein
MMAGSHIQSCGAAKSSRPACAAYRSTASAYSVAVVIHRPCRDSSVNPPESSAHLHTAGWSGP